MKTWCIEFERKDIIYVKQKEKPTEEEAEDMVENAGYILNKGYDEIINIYEV